MRVQSIASTMYMTRMMAKTTIHNGDLVTHLVHGSAQAATVLSGQIRLSGEAPEVPSRKMGRTLWQS